MARPARDSSGEILMAALCRGALRLMQNRSKTSAADSPPEADALRLT